MWWRNVNFVETENAYVIGHIHPVSARIPGVVSRILVEDNQTVQAGDPIAELDPTDQRMKAAQIAAQIASAEQQVLQAEAQIAQVRALASGTTAQVTQSEAQLRRATQDAQRLSQLYSAQMKAVSKAELDGANALRDGATADLSARHDAVTAARAQVAVASSARDIIKAQIAVLRIQLDEAKQQLAYHRILAPAAGRIGRRSMELGMRVQPGQQLAALVQEDVWVTANFKETQLSNLRPGQTAKLSIDALPDVHLLGRLDSFSPASGTQFALLPADNATGNFTKVVQRFPVKIILRPEDVKALGARLVPGMSVTAEVALRQPAPLKLTLR
jgi:membrane fusion protein (multidrug efflux system)